MRPLNGRLSEVSRSAGPDRATPERMDGGNVAADFHNRFAAEIRLASH